VAIPDLSQRHQFGACRLGAIQQHRPSAGVTKHASRCKMPIQNVFQPPLGFYIRFDISKDETDPSRTNAPHEFSN